MVGRSVLVVCALAALAHADSAKLAKARAAIDAVRYDQAQQLLVETLQAGDNSPEAVAEIYRLSASVAIVLGQREVAERYYRRWLALDPAATLPDSVAPKLREPFVAAQAYMAARGRLSVKVTRAPDVVDVLVDSDPLAMVAAIGGGDAKVPVGADHHAKLRGTQITTVVALDELGNHLLEVEVPPAEPTHVEHAEPLPPPPPPPPPTEVPVADTHVSIARRPIAWLAPAVVLGGVGVAFAFGAHDADGQLADVIAHSSQHFFGEADALRNRRDRDAVIADVALVASAACLATAIVVYAIRPSARVAPTASGVALRW